MIDWTATTAQVALANGGAHTDEVGRQLKVRRRGQSIKFSKARQKSDNIESFFC